MGVWVWGLKFNPKNKLPATPEESEIKCLPTSVNNKIFW
jgi:hypothetical protein